MKLRDIEGVARRKAKSAWTRLKWALRVSISIIAVLPFAIPFLLVLMALVDTRFWNVLELLVVPAALILLARWLDRQEAKRQKDERVKRERYQIEVDYMLGLLELEAKRSVRAQRAAADLDAREVADAKRVFNTEKRLLEKRKELKLAQLEEIESLT